MSALRLELWQASQRYTVRPAAAHADFASILAHAPDAVGFTEATSFHAELRRACRRHAFQLFLPPAGDTAIAVWGGHLVMDHHYVKVNAASAHPRHTERGIQSVTFKPASAQEVVTVAEAHWLTRRADDGGQRVAMTEAMGDVIAHAAQGHRLGFWLGDTNNPDRTGMHAGRFSDVDKALRKADLTSCWDELGRYPATHEDSTLDVVGSYDPDRRVSCLRARVWPQLASDHRPISALYHVSPVRRS